MGHYCYEFIFDTGNDVFYGGSGNDDIIALEDRPQNSEAQVRGVHPLSFPQSPATRLGTPSSFLASW
jgi:hypothetical protein